MHVDVILRTHDIQNVHNDWRVRFCKMDKNELIKGCFNSLLNSIKNVRGHVIHFKVLDDHSSDDFISFLKEKQKEWPFEIIQLEEEGYRYSAHQQFLMCRNSKSDYVYSIEDDYLHTETAIQEMIDSIILFEEKLNVDNVLLYPFDALDQYNPPDNCFLVRGANYRHWRTGIYTTNVMMAKPKLFKENWPLFEVLALNYDGSYYKLSEKEEGFRYTEDNTIWNIWRHGKAIRFNPVPSLALHMQFDAQFDPLIDWKVWWEKYAK